LDVLAKVLWEKGVDVEIALSNPGSIPGDLSATEANYGNGWQCVDVAAEIIKSIKKLYPEASDNDLRKKVEENLRVCFIRHRAGNTYSDGNSIGLHAKHFIVDDVCTYIGSQNLYMCDLAEWGVVIDDESTVRRMMKQYWEPLWEVSYDPNDCDVGDVMDGLDLDRDGKEQSMFSSAEEKKQFAQAQKQQALMAGNKDYYDDSDDDSFN
jgi:phosphatidylserine/phosphatidylglycerophosphate/cardiolipin synthase-like enzyme